MMMNKKTPTLITMYFTFTSRTVKVLGTKYNVKVSILYLDATTQPVVSEHKVVR